MSVRVALWISEWYEHEEEEERAGQGTLRMPALLERLPQVGRVGSSCGRFGTVGVETKEQFRFITPARLARARHGLTPTTPY